MYTRQLVLHVVDRHPFKNFHIDHPKKLKQGFQSRILLQLEPGPPILSVEHTWGEVSDSVIVRDPCRFEKTRYQARQAAALRKQDADSIAIIIGKKCGR